MARMRGEFEEQVLSRLDKIEGRLDVFEESMTTLTRIIDRMDQRLVEVEKHTTLIPGISDALSNQADDLDRHEMLLKKIAQNTGLALT